MPSSIRTAARAAAPVALLLLAAAIAGLSLWSLPRWQTRHLESQAERITVANDTRRTVAQIVGGALVLVGLYSAWKTLEQTRQTQVNDRFIRGLELLGMNKSLESRVGAAYVLEQVGIDSDGHRRRVLDVLASFVRVSAQLRGPMGSHAIASGAIGVPRPTPRADTQAALDAIGKLAGTTPARACLIDLRETDLRGARLTGGHFRGAVFAGTDLAGANLMYADLSGTALVDARLAKANLTGANLTNAALISADLQGAVLEEAVLRNAKLWKANLRAANLRGADLRGAEFYTNPPPAPDVPEKYWPAVGLTRVQIQSAKVDSTTKLPDGLAPES